MEDQTLPLPTHEEVLICNEYTTDEEVTLLWKRAMGDPNHFRIFCLVYAEKLSYQVCDKVLVHYWTAHKDKEVSMYMSIVILILYLSQTTSW